MLKYTFRKKTNFYNLSFNLLVFVKSTTKTISPYIMPSFVTSAAIVNMLVSIFSKKRSGNVGFIFISLSMYRSFLSKSPDGKTGLSFFKNK